MISHLAMTADEVEPVMNDPEIARRMNYVAGTWRWAAALKNNCRAWVFPGGVFLVHEETPDLAQVHVAVLPASRGKRAVQAARDSLRAEVRMNSRIRLYGRTPTMYRDALMFALGAGMRLVGENGDEWVTEATWETHGEAV